MRNVLLLILFFSLTDSLLGFIISQQEHKNNPVVRAFFSLQKVYHQLIVKQEKKMQRGKFTIDSWVFMLMVCKDVSSL